MTRPENSYQIVLKPGTDNTLPAIAWKTRENGKEVVYDREPSDSAWRRTRVHFLSLLPLDPEL
jgi:putative cardiolipin synthase